jgi:hypothetical protein
MLLPPLPLLLLLLQVVQGRLHRCLVAPGPHRHCQVLENP